MPAPLTWTWRRLVAVTLAKALLVGLLGLAAWGALPAAIGWHPTTVSSGSMMPRLHVGDIAVSRPLGSHVPPLTSVLLFHDPDHPGRLRMHRFVRLDDDGLLVTRGDANNADDSTPVGLGAVVGIGTLRVPWIALPIVWLRTGGWLDLGLVAAALGLLLVVASSGRDRVFPEDDPPDDPDQRPAGSGPGSADGAVDSASGAGAVRADRVRTVTRRGAAVLGVGLLAIGLTTPADARFAGTTATTVSLTASSTTCASTVAALNPYLYYRMDETSSTTTATDSSGNGRDGTYSSNGRTSTWAQACVNDSGRAMTFDGSSGSLSSRALSNGTPSTFSLAIWFQTTRAGGMLIGVEDDGGRTSSSGRFISMSDRSGRIRFGTSSSSTTPISTSSSYDDGSWHLAVATASSAGTRLYLDGALADSDSSTVSRSSSTAYVRVAYSASSSSSSSNPYFSGTLDDATLFTSVLTASQVASLYAAGTS